MSYPTSMAAIEDDYRTLADALTEAQRQSAVRWAKVDLRALRADTRYIIAEILEEVHGTPDAEA